MKRLTLFIFSSTLLLASCSKSTIVKNINQQKNTGFHSKILARDGDDDRPIIIHHVTDENNVALPGSQIWIYNTTDTVTGITDSVGNCITPISELGSWHVLVIHASYQNWQRDIIAADSATKITESMNAL